MICLQGTKKLRKNRIQGIRKVRVNAQQAPKIGDVVCWTNHEFNVWRVIELAKGTTDEVAVITLEADPATCDFGQT